MNHIGMEAVWNGLGDMGTFGYICREEENDGINISAMGVLVINRTLTEMILALQNYSVSAEADEFINQLNKESENE